jgi:BirA family biotin operon repressor/biotin-[acetyl-CoA-carboxylase] ligase
MKQLAVHNPFNAPVYYEETVSSTMEISRTLAQRGEAHGTVIVAGFQEAGRGRISQRLWDMEKGDGLPFTLLLRYPRIEDIPPALTLRMGLAVSLAIEDFAPALTRRVMIKWPNDIMIAMPVQDSPEEKTDSAERVKAAGTVYAKKVAGILAEADGGNVHIGIGVNVTQKKFPGHLEDKASSIYLAAGKLPFQTAGKVEERFALLEKILVYLHKEIAPESNGFLNEDWRSRIEARLYKKGELVNFAESAADSGKIVTGILTGIGQGGELLISPAGSTEEESSLEIPRSFIVGELLFDDYHRLNS